MRVVSGVIEEQKGQWFFDFEYKPEYPSFENFFRWFTRPAGPFWKWGAQNVFASTVTDIGDGQARIRGGHSVKSMHAELCEIYPSMPC